MVVGGGAVPLALGLELSRRGLETLLLDPDPPFGGAASPPGAPAGLVNPQARIGEGPEALVDLSLLARHLYGGFIETLEEETGLACEYDVRGGMTAALSEAEEVALDRALDAQRSRALPFEVLPGEEARAAFSFPEDGQLLPERLLKALALAAIRAGATVARPAPAASVRVEAGRVAGVETPWGLVRAEVVVLASGVPSGLVPGGLALSLVTLRAPHALLDASGDPDRLTRFVVAAGCALVPRRDGTLLVAGDGECAGLDGCARSGEAARLLARAAEVVPASASYPLLGTWACLAVASSDGLPLLGETAVPGLILAAGEGRDGVLLAPAAALVLADLLTGRTPPLPPAPFSPARFGL